MTTTTTTTGRATREQLDQLHGLVAQAMLHYMTTTPEGQHRASMLDVIRGFLRDNGMTKDIPALADQKAALTVLTGLTLPFGHA